jgi:hypothetical protein
MPEPERVQLPRSVVALWWLFIAVLVGILLVCARPLFEPVGTDVAHRAIKRSAELPVLLWCMGVWVMIWPRAFGVTADKLVAGWFPWTAGCVLLLLHIAVAFHLGHGWSHGGAWEHTRQIGGYGDGIFVNYAFALVWLADVIWMWAAPASYRARPRWLHWSIHGFLAFVVFNAAVVFAAWSFRFLFALWFLGWPVFLVLVRRYVQRRVRSKVSA